MAIPAANYMQNNTGGNGRFKPLRRNQKEVKEGQFDIDGELKDLLDRLDDTAIRTRFAQTSDPVYLAFRHIESKPLKALAKEFVQDVKSDFIEFISGVFQQ